MDRDGDNVTRLTDYRAENRSPAFSPDGSRIAFMSNRAGNRNIFIMNKDGSDAQQLTDEGVNMDPSWSPDGKRIVFISNRSGQWVVHTMNPKGGEVSSLGAVASFWQSRPVFSPDGNKIAFGSIRDDIFGDIFIMNSDGSEVENLTPDEMAGQYPVWSPDGKTLAFYGSADPRAREPWRVYLIDLETRDIAQLTDFSAEPHAWAWFPAAR